MQQYSTTDDLYNLDAFYSSPTTETSSSHLQYASYQGLVSTPSLNYCTPQATNNGFASQPQQHQQYHGLAAYDYQTTTPAISQRHVPSTRAYSYHPYNNLASTTGPLTPGAYSPVQVSPRVSHYVSPWETASGLVSASSLSVGNEYSFVDYGVINGIHGNGTIHPSQLFNTPSESCAATTLTLANAAPTTVDPHSLTSHALYSNGTVNPYNTYNAYPTSLYSQQQQQQQQQLPTCINPEDLYTPLPLTPVSPASLEDSSSDDRDSSPLDSSHELSTPSMSSGSTRSTPARPGLTIPTVSLMKQQQQQESAIWSNSNSTLPSPVDSLSSKASSSDHEPSFIPTASLKKSTAAAATAKGAKRATRSAAPEPAWVEAVLKEDANRLLQEAGSVPTPARGANRPIAFACVFCRHRKIQCIRPKTEVAPGEKPAPCNQCEKRNRCCEYPPAALNPRVVRRVRDRPATTPTTPTSAVAGEC